MSDDVINKILTLVAVLVGGGITFFTQFFLERYRNKNEARGVALAAAAEASAIADTIRFRRWVEGVVDRIEDAEIDGKVSGFVVSLPEGYLVVMKAAAAKAGLLPGSLPRFVAKLVVCGDGIVSDIRRMAEQGVEDENSLTPKSDPKQSAMFYREFLAAMLHGLELCDLIVDEVLRLYPNDAQGLKGDPPGSVELEWRARLS